MNKRIRVLISCTLFAAGPCQSPRQEGPEMSAQQAPHDSTLEAKKSATEQEIIDLIGRYDEAWDQKDVARVGVLLSDEYVYFGSRGNVVSRKNILEFLRSPTYVLHAANRSEFEVYLYGTTAVVGSRWRGRGTYDGGPFEDDQRCSIVLVRENDAWRIVLEHCTPIAGR